MIKKGQIVLLLTFGLVAVGNSKQAPKIEDVSQHALNKIEDLSVDVLKMCGADMKTASVPSLDSMKSTIVFVHKRIAELRYAPSGTVSDVPKKELDKYVELTKIPTDLRHKALMAFTHCYLYREFLWKQEHNKMKSETVSKFGEFLSALIKKHASKPKPKPKPAPKPVPKKMPESDKDRIIRKVCKHAIEKMNKRSESQDEKDKDSIDEMCIKLMEKLWHHINGDDSSVGAEKSPAEKPATKKITEPETPKKPNEKSNDHIKEICKHVIDKMNKRSESGEDDEDAISSMCIRMMEKLWYHIDSDVSPVIEEKVTEKTGGKSDKTKRQGPTVKIEYEIAKKNRREASPGGSSDYETQKKVADTLIESLEESKELDDITAPKDKKKRKVMRRGLALRIQGEVAKKKRNAGGSSEYETQEKVADTLLEELENENADSRDNDDDDDNED